MDNKGIDVAKLSDLTLRKSLTESGLTVGPVTSKNIVFFLSSSIFRILVLDHTRAIYQRKLLEVVTNETSEGKFNQCNLK